MITASNHRMVQGYLSGGGGGGVGICFVQTFHMNIAATNMGFSLISLSFGILIDDKNKFKINEFAEMFREKKRKNYIESRL